MKEKSVRLGFARDDLIFLYGAGAAVGLGVGVAVPFVARWAADLPWLPFQGPLQLVGSFDSSWATWGRPVLGLLAGLAFAAWVVFQSPVLQVSDEEIEITNHGSTRVLIRTDIAGIYRDGRLIVMESHHGRRLFRGEIEGNKDAVRNAFISRGYPWESR